MKHKCTSFIFLPRRKWRNIIFKMQIDERKYYLNLAWRRNQSNSLLYDKYWITRSCKSEALSAPGDGKELTW